MAIHQISEQLFLIELNQNIRGFQQFVSAWLFRGHKRSVLVDPGPTSTISIVKQALRDLHVNWLDCILLTHIHIDHAGGTGMLMSTFPEARIICHPKGIPHMIDPEKLWRGSLAVLGEVAEKYGKIIKVHPNQISYENAVDKGSLHVDVIETPGHAAHHLSYLIDGLLFAGEAAGVHVVDRDISYLRPATPPRFIYDVYRGSILKLMELKAQYICFGHFGLHDDVDRVLQASLTQLDLWWDTVRRSVDLDEEKIADILLGSDPQLARFGELSAPLRERERYFMKNSLKGMLSAAREEIN